MVNKMGWYGTYTEYENVADYVEHELDFNSETIRQLDRAIVNNTIYTLIEIIDGNEKGLRTICVHLISKVDNNWMYKSMGETCGPYYYDCPERILKHSTNMNATAIEWRDTCRAIRKNKANKLRLVKQLKSGTIIESNHYGHIEFIYKYNKGGSLIVCKSSTGTFKYKIEHITVEELDSAISS